MENLLKDLIVNLIGGVDGAINSAFNGLMNTCFNAEYELTHLLGHQVISLESLKTLIFSVALSLIILKFLKKGFDIYILWTEGEADTPPLTFVVYFIRAVVTLICSMLLYDWLVAVVQDVRTKNAGVIKCCTNNGHNRHYCWLCWNKSI